MRICRVYNASKSNQAISPWPRSAPDLAIFEWSKLWISFCVVFVFNTASFAQQPLQQFNELYQQEDLNSEALIGSLEYAASFPVTRATSYYNLGVIHYLGHGVEQDLGLAGFWFRQAALLGFPQASYAMAVLHYLGQAPFEKNMDSVKFWLENAASAGDPNAELALGSLLFAGTELERDELLGIVLMKRALEKQMSIAPTYLAWAEEQLYFDRQQDLNWIKQQLPYQYTIELHAAITELDARQFISYNDLEGAKVFRNQRDIWVVITGNYASEAMAKESLADTGFTALMSNVKVRTFASVQQQVLAQSAVLNDSWVLLQDDFRFTAVLYCAVTRAAVHDFVSINGVQAAAIVRLGIRDYCATAGVFDNKQLAQQAIDSLPSALQVEQPFIKSFTEIKTKLYSAPTSLHVPYLEQLAPRFSISAELALNLHHRELDYQLVQPIQWSREDWLSIQSAELYTLELFRGKTEQQAVDVLFLSKVSNATIFKSKKGVYVLIAGVFNSEQHIAEVLQSAPEDIKALDTQARRFMDVRREWIPSI